MTTKIAWAGRIVSIQPRIRLTRSFDECSESYLGFTLRVRGVIEEQEREFTVGIGEEAQEKWTCLAGLRVDLIARSVTSAARTTATG